MRYLAICAATVGLLAMTMNVGTTSAATAGVSNPAIQLAQAEQPKKSETVTQKVKRKVKRAWRNMTGYKFDVACPALIPMSHERCTETGKDRETARAKCQSAHTLCSVRDVN
jgi:hypothetical protein